MAAATFTPNQIKSNQNLTKKASHALCNSKRFNIYIYKKKHITKPQPALHPFHSVPLPHMIHDPTFNEYL